MPVELRTLLDPAGTVLLTVECQQGVVGRRSAMPELADEARRSGMLDRVAELAEAARARGVQVVHAVAERRPDGRGANGNARLFRAAERLPVQQLSGTDAVLPAPPLTLSPEDLVVRRLHGLTAMGGTDLDPLLRNLGCRTLVVTGVSVNVAIPGTVLEAVNHGYTVVVPGDAVAGLPAQYAQDVLRHSLALVATVVTTREVLEVWRA